MSDIFGGEELPEVPDEIVNEPAEKPAETTQEVQEVPEAPRPVVGEDSKVPLAALNESRAQLRQTQSELNQMREQMKQFEALRTELEESRTRARQQQEEQQFNQDPLGMIQRQLKELQTKVETTSFTQQTQAQQREQEQQLFSTIASQVNEFKKATPDYDDALQHVLEARKQELMTMGADEYMANQRVAAEAQEIAMNALRAGQNPGQIVYQLAKLRGYGARQASQKLETVAKGQQASGSLSGASGGADKGELSLSEVDSMSDEEFDKFWAKMSPKNR